MINCMPRWKADRTCREHCRRNIAIEALPPKHCLGNTATHVLPQNHRLVIGTRNWRPGSCKTELMIWSFDSARNIRAIRNRKFEIKINLMPLKNGQLVPAIYHFNQATVIAVFTVNLSGLPQALTRLVGRLEVVRTLRISVNILAFLLFSAWWPDSIHSIHLSYSRHLSEVVRLLWSSSCLDLDETLMSNLLGST